MQPTLKSSELWPTNKSISLRASTMLGFRPWSLRDLIQSISFQPLSPKLSLTQRVLTSRTLRILTPRLLALLRVSPLRIMRMLSWLTSSQPLARSGSTSSGARTTVVANPLTLSPHTLHTTPATLNSSLPPTRLATVSRPNTDSRLLTDSKFSSMLSQLLSNTFSQLLSNTFSSQRLSSTFSLLSTVSKPVTNSNTDSSKLDMVNSKATMVPVFTDE